MIYTDYVYFDKKKMEMKTKKYLTAGTYPKTNGKIVEMEKKNRYENQNYHTVGFSRVIFIYFCQDLSPLSSTIPHQTTL
jgi:hypothetical protein